MCVCVGVGGWVGGCVDELVGGWEHACVRACVRACVCTLLLLSIFLVFERFF